LQAPLHLNVADAPPDGRAFWVKASDGVRIRFAIWDGSKGSVLIFPGRTEYIEKYGRVVSKLGKLGYGAIVIDWRNQGLSDRAARTGHVESYDEYQRDIKAVLNSPERLKQKQPYHLMSHSMGGLIALRSIRSGIDVDVESCVFSAPMWGMGLAGPIKNTLKVLASIASTTGAGKQKVFGTKRGSYIKDADPDNNSLMSDPETAKWIQKQLLTYPELALGGPSWAWLKASHKEISALSGFSVPDIPTLTLLGDLEAVVDPEAIRKRIASPKNGRLLLCHGAKHEVLMEKEHIQKPVWTAIEQLLEERSNPMS